MSNETTITFDQLGLSTAIVSTLEAIGYKTPTAIQAASIPALLDGKDILGQAQTGTGKTAAFALPLLSNLNLRNKQPQVLVLAPTRELAIQVSEAFKSYSTGLKGFQGVPIYGGQSMSNQLRQLKNGAHVIVGTPGRVMDHIRRGSLKLDQLQAVVLDEADEMLKMGFIEDIEWILEHTPEQKQVALFSATMPDSIRRIARKHLNDAEEIKIKTKTRMVESISQSYWMVKGIHKLDALTRLLEVQDVDAAIIFARTKTATVEIAEKLEARGYSCAALNGDLNQSLRERTIDRLKKGDIDIIVATDVAARGIDVERVSHVVNYDIPRDTEAYVHRIGRTGRAGRSGTAILFVSPREKRLLQAIEKMTRQKIEELNLPSRQDVTAKRIKRFKDQVGMILKGQDLSLYQQITEEIAAEHEVSEAQAASALCFIAQKDSPFIIKERAPREERKRGGRSGGRSGRSSGRKRNDRGRKSSKRHSGGGRGASKSGGKSRGGSGGRSFSSKGKSGGPGRRKRSARS